MTGKAALGWIMILIGGICILVRFGGPAKIFGLVLIVVSAIFLIVLLKDNEFIKKHIKKSKKEKSKETSEIIRRKEETKELEKYDVDSGLEYCACCGNYSVKKGRCEVCGEKVTE